MPAVHYLFDLEKFGFAFYDIITSKEETSKNKLSIKDIKQFSISYNSGDFSENECTETIRKSIYETDSCGLADSKTGKCGNGQNCGGVVFKHKDKKYIKCTRYFCTFKDLSEQAIENYIKLIELENNELQNQNGKK